MVKPKVYTKTREKPAEKIVVEFMPDESKLERRVYRVRDRQRRMKIRLNSVRQELADTKDQVEDLCKQMGLMSTKLSDMTALVDKLGEDLSEGLTLGTKAVNTAEHMLDQVKDTVDTHTVTLETYYQVISKQQTRCWMKQELRKHNLLRSDPS
jgi:chromosome segregation ATPase